MNMERLSGGAAAGAALAVFLTHGADYSIEEIAALATGFGAAITYLVKLGELVFLGDKDKTADAIGFELAPEDKDDA